MNKILVSLNQFATVTAYRGTKPICTWAKCTREDGSSYWQTVEEGDLTGPEISSEDLAGVLEVLKGTGVILNFNNHSGV